MTHEIKFAHLAKKGNVDFQVFKLLDYRVTN